MVDGSLKAAMNYEPWLLYSWLFDYSIGVLGDWRGRQKLVGAYCYMPLQGQNPMAGSDLAEAIGPDITYPYKFD